MLIYPTLINFVTFDILQASITRSGYFNWRLSQIWF